MKTKTTITLLFIAASLAACDPGSLDPPAAPTPTEMEASPMPAASPEAVVGAAREVGGCLDLPEKPPGGMTRVELWFTDGDDKAGLGTSVVVHRDVPTTNAIARAALQAWIDGPTEEEEAVGALRTASKGTELLGIDIDGDTATVDLTRDFERTNLGTTGEGQILEALGGTLTQFDIVGRGLLKIDGELKDYFMGHGFLVSDEHPLIRPGRKRYRLAQTC